MEQSISPAELYKQALTLSTADRAMLARLLLDSLEEGAEDGVEEAWREEVERRMHELDHGTVTPIAWEQVRARLLKHGTA